MLPNISLLRKEIMAYEAQREKLVALGREVVRLSKRVIYAVHRGEKPEFLKHMTEKKKKLDILVKKTPALAHEGSYRVAIQEFVEAWLYNAYVMEGRFPSHKELDVSAGLYVLGVCDLTGELVRKAVYLAGKGKKDEVIAIRDLVDEIYGQFLSMDFRDNETRRKFDSIKYDLRKLEDLCLQVTFSHKR